MKIPIEKLKFYCNASERELWDHILKDPKWNQNGGTFLYRTFRKSKVLAIAHMDTVFDSHKSRYDFRECEVGNDILAFSPNLDDRLGVFIIMEMLPRLGITTDILFTTDEEICDSSAQNFPKYCKKDYNWIVEFDRAGEDVVLYRYKDYTEDIVKDLKSVDFSIGTGTYTDIGELEEMRTGAFNVGIGYHFQHSEQCFASLQEMVNQLAKFKKFLDKFKNKKYVFSPPAIQPGRSKWFTSGYGMHGVGWEDREYLEEYYKEWQTKKWPGIGKSKVVRIEWKGLPWDEETQDYAWDLFTDKHWEKYCMLEPENLTYGVGSRQEAKEERVAAYEDLLQEI
jgi:hypothetical protein